MLPWWLFPAFDAYHCRYFHRWRARMHHSFGYYLQNENAYSWHLRTVASPDSGHLGKTRDHNPPSQHLDRWLETTGWVRSERIVAPQLQSDLDRVCLRHSWLRRSWSGYPERDVEVLFVFGWRGLCSGEPARYLFQLYDQAGNWSHFLGRRESLVDLGYRAGPCLLQNQDFWPHASPKRSWLPHSLILSPEDLAWWWFRAFANLGDQLVELYEEWSGCRHRSSQTLLLILCF